MPIRTKSIRSCLKIRQQFPNRPPNDAIASMMANMSLAVTRITDRVLNQLAGREMRLLSLVVAVRKDIGGSEGFKGDLSECVKGALRKLVLRQEVVETEGMYSLATPAATAQTTTASSSDKK